MFVCFFCLRVYPFFFSTCFTFHTEVIPTTPGLSLQHRPQSAPIKHKVLFSPVVVDTSKQRTGSKNNQSRTVFCQVWSLKKFTSQSHVPHWNTLYTLRCFSSVWSLSTCFLFHSLLSTQRPFRKTSSNQSVKRVRKCKVAWAFNN